MDILKISGLFGGTPCYILTRYLRGICAVSGARHLHIIPLAFLGENQYTGEKGESNEEEILSVL